MLWHGCSILLLLFGGIVIVNAPLMVTKIPTARESTSRLGPITIGKMANIRIISMTVHSVGFPLVAEKTRIGREFQFRTFFILTAVWFQVGVEVFARKMISVALD